MLLSDDLNDRKRNWRVLSLKLIVGVPKLVNEVKEDLYLVLRTVYTLKVVGTCHCRLDTLLLLPGLDLNGCCLVGKE